MVLVGPMIEGDPLGVVSGAGAALGVGEGDEGSLGVGLEVEVLDESLEDDVVADDVTADDVAAADGFILETALSSPVSWTDQKP